MEKIVIYGAGGFGRELAYLIELINEKKPTYDLIGFIDDGSQFKIGEDINNYPFLGRGDWLINHKDISCACAIANVNVRKIIFEKYKEKGIHFATIIAPGVRIHKTNYIGEGCIIAGGCGLTVNIKLGEGVFLNGGVVLGHDVSIGDFTTIFPRTDISGFCDIGSQVTIGGHSFITPSRKIGSNAVIAAGSIVFSNVKAGTTVLGNPARRMRAIEG